MRDRWMAIMLAFCLGGLGAHRFYLKQPFMGFMHLLLCWTFIPSFVAAVNAIVWMLWSDNRFNEKYNGFLA
jgi:TM2 domain-containing membrane protein YozV